MNTHMHASIYQRNATNDGMEECFQVNHIAPIAMSLLLMPSLTRTRICTHIRMYVCMYVYTYMHEHNSATPQTTA
jgi:hypothetical protein